MNLRGRLASVINFRKKLGFEPKEHDEDTRVIVVELDTFPVGIIVDSVQEVIKIPDEKVQKLPESTTTSASKDYMTGVGMLDDRLVILLDVDKVLTVAELIELGEINQMVDKAEEALEPVETNQKMEKAEEAPELVETNQMAVENGQRCGQDPAPSARPGRGMTPSAATGMTLPAWSRCGRTQTTSRRREARKAKTPHLHPQTVSKSPFLSPFTSCTYANSLRVLLHFLAKSVSVPANSGGTRFSSGGFFGRPRASQAKEDCRPGLDLRQYHDQAPETVGSWHE